MAVVTLLFSGCSVRSICLCPARATCAANPKVLTGITEFIRTQESLGQQGIHVKDFVKAIFLDQAICRDGFSRRVFWAGWAYRPQQLPGATL